MIDLLYRNGRLLPLWIQQGVQTLGASSWAAIVTVLEIHCLVPLALFGEKSGRRFLACGRTFLQTALAGARTLHEANSYFGRLLVVCCIGLSSASCGVEVRSSTANAPLPASTPRSVASATSTPLPEPEASRAAAPDNFDNLAMFTARGIQITAFNNGRPHGAQYFPMPSGVVDSSRHNLAWSPDGHQLVYGANITTTGHFEDHLFVVDLRTGSQTDVGRGWLAAWSPDGKALVTVAQTVNRIDLIDLTTGRTTPLTDEQVFWSAPFFLAEHPGYVFAAGMALENMGGRGTGHYDFYAIPLNGSRHLNLSVWPRSGSGRLPTDIEVSPDGNWLLYTGQDTAGPSAVILDHTTLPVSEGTSFFYQPAPESVPTEYADAGVYYSGLQFGWLPDSRGYLAMRLFSYEIGQYYDPDYAITSDFDRCVLDVVNPKGLVIGTLPICPSDVAVNPEMTLLAAPIKLTETRYAVQIYDLTGKPLTTLRYGYGVTFAP